MAEHEGTNTEVSYLLMKLIAAFDTVFVLGEMIFYILIYKFMSDHNSSMLTSSIISVETYKHRQRSSAISATGQMYCFLLKLVYTSILALAVVLRGYYPSIQVLEIVNISRIIQFGVLSVVQVCSTSTLRKELFEFFARLHR